MGVDEYFLKMAVLASQRGTCARRKVGCVLVDEHNHVMATGYNGVARGVSHCVDVPCPGAHLASGTGLEACQAIHAEANALLQCHDPQVVATVYCTTSPCINCTRLLLNTGAKRVVFAEEYPHPQARELWESIRGARLHVPSPITGDGYQLADYHTVATWQCLPLVD